MAPPKFPALTLPHLHGTGMGDLLLGGVGGKMQSKT